MCIDKYEFTSIGGKECRIDSCIADIVRGLDIAGAKPIASCCGHFNRWGSIILKDGRELLIVPDFESGRAFDKIHGRPIHDDRRALKNINVAAEGVPSRDKPASLSENASLTDRIVSDGVPPSENTNPVKFEQHYLGKWVVAKCSVHTFDGVPCPDEAVHTVKHKGKKVGLCKRCFIAFQNGAFSRQKRNYEDRLYIS